jgi:prepilin-type N-terminal cleavage/methylation domain-containing protein
MITRIARWTRRLHGRDDKGFTLMEVMVGAALMSVVMAVATSGFVSMYHTADKTEANALTESNLMLSFAKLDREVRYAYRVNPPYMANTNTFAVDYVLADNQNVMQCVQLTLPVAGGALIRKQWPLASNSANPAAVTSGVATNLVTANKTTDAGGATVAANPFTLLASRQGGSDFDRLKINMNSRAGITSLGATRNYNLQFNALNTQEPSISLTCTKA